MTYISSAKEGRFLSQAAQASRRTPIDLLPEIGVELVNGRMHAATLPFWLRVEPIDVIRRYKWIRVRYSSSFFDEPVRPLIRFQTADGLAHVQAMNAATLGSAEWLGRVPDRTLSISINPNRQLGAFSFRIDEIHPISRLKLLRRGFRTEPLMVAWAIQSRLINARKEAQQALTYGAAGTDFREYDAWQAHLRRDLDLEGIDQPHFAWTTTPHIHLFIAPGRALVSAIDATFNSLKAQVYQQWSLHVVIDQDTSPEIVSALRKWLGTDSRFCEFSINAADNSNYHENDRLAVIDAGAVLPDYALAVVAETLAATPDLALVYSDEDCIGPLGNYHTPIFKPDWSPIFYEQTHYVGRLTCIRFADLLAAGASIPDLFFNEQVTISDICAKAKPKSIGHIRRVLYHNYGQPTRLDMQPKLEITTTTMEPRWPGVAIIIPTRDRAKLLVECVRGLREKTDYPSMQVVIIDNGSTQQEALTFLAELTTDHRFTVLKRPGPFNYSRLCNEGVRATDAPLMVFLNNDVQMIEPDWLKALARWAIKPEVGAVGAKLLFPNGQVQHAGVVVGLGGIAGHVYGRTPAADSGYLRQLNTTREMLAVTGACLAIEREKFEAVGGFDEVHLPIDLNDIDFCLRLAKNGLTNLWTPDAVLVHLQSASRGIKRDAFKKYRLERTYFTATWADEVRDDPYFHSGLSLFSQKPKLA